MFFPHTRGWSCNGHTNAKPYIVFPAHAGVIPDEYIYVVRGACFSRTRGGDPTTYAIMMITERFFPHTRGWSQRWQHNFKLFKVFPAHAGVILLLYQLLPHRSGFSRTRGGDSTNLGHMEIRQYQSIGWGLFLDLLISWLLFKYCRCKQHILKIEML